MLAETARPGVRSVVSTARGSTADLRLLDGQLRVTATATGRSGGAKAGWNAPAVTVSLAGQEQTLPADGTGASASLLHVVASLGTADLGVTVLDTDLFPLQASATAPAGGVDCAAGSGQPIPGDPDGDGLDTGDEIDHGTDPGVADTDGDRLSDGREARAGSDPLDPQSGPDDVRQNRSTSVRS